APAAEAAAAPALSSASTGRGRRLGHDVDLARRHARAGAERDVLRFSSEQEPSVGVELDHLIRARVDNPDVVLRIHAHLLREVHGVDTLAYLLHELARRVELKQPRTAVIEGP